MYQRTEHNAACPCEDCCKFDAAKIRAALPKQGVSWREGGLERVLHFNRSRDLNWTLEPGHCGYCGGFDLFAGLVSEHELVKNHNPKVDGDRAFVSLLIADDSGWLATARGFAACTKSPWTGKPVEGKVMLMQWVAHMLRYPREQAVAVATRKLEGWTEFRIGLRLIQ